MKDNTRSTIAWRGALIAMCVFIAPLAHGRGPSPYLPLNMAPYTERQIERVLILAGKPIMRRPIAAAVVLEALPVACERDRALCESVRAYLQRYMGKFEVTHARVQGAVTSGDSEMTRPNQHGESVDSAWNVALSAHYQPNDFLIVNLGANAYDGEQTPTGSFLSAGFDFAQIDIGFRDHWLGPMQDSSALISTNAPTMPSITISNYKPLTRLGLSYEIFGAEMSRQDDIAYEGGTTSGNPRLAGLQLAAEPVTGYAVSINRITQYGGGARGGSGLSDFFDALLTTTNVPDTDNQGNENVNRIASIASNMLFPGPVPFGVRLEYSGEDNAYAGKLRLGQTNLSAGIDFPVLWRHFDASYELSEFQNGWYVHSVYPDGPRSEGHVIGHWFGDNREVPSDAIGGRSHTIQLGWQLPWGGYASARYRTLSLDTRWTPGNSAERYRTMDTLGLTYSTQWGGYPIDAQLEIGDDVFGDSFARVAASIDFGGEVFFPAAHTDDGGVASPNVEVFVAIGAAHSSAEKIFEVTGPNVNTPWDTTAHVGFGARRRVSERNDLGVRFEADEVDGYRLLSVRALDYRFRITRRFAIGGFFGVGRYDFGLPSYGYYFGAGLQYIDVLPKWDISLDFRHHDKLGRDKLLPNDPPSTPDRTRLFFDIDGVALYISRRL